MEGGSKVVAVTTRSVPFSPLIDTKGHDQVGPAVNLEASTGMPASVSSRPDLTVTRSPQPPAYTYLKQHLQPLQIFN
jgi:hypothetical protein